MSNISPSFTTRPDGGRIAYRIHGGASGACSRPTVLLVRPLGGTMALWGRFRDQLAEQYRVLSFDLRGCGESSPTPRITSTQEIAGDAIAVMDAVGVRRAHVFGISLGGMAATWLAIDHPQRVARLCIAAAPTRGLEVTHNGLLRELALAACLLRPQPQVEVKMVHRLLSREFRASHPREVEWIEREVGRQPSSRTTLAHLALAALRHDARDRVEDIRAPTLVLAGGHDALLGIDAPKQLADAIGAQFEVVAGSGHDLTLERPIPTANAAATFFGAAVSRPVRLACSQ